MAQEYTQEQLEEMVEGRPEQPRAIFYDKAVLNVSASKASGMRRYDKAVYIKLVQPGLTDNMSYRAQSADINEYPTEYEYFLSNRQGERAPGVEIIPNLDITHLQELRDYGILTVPQLANIEQVPEHLEYARKSAIMINSVLQESKYANEEESIEENRIETQDVPSQDRPKQHNDVRQPEFPRGIRNREVPEASQGTETSRPAHGGQSIDNWKAEFSA